MKKRLLCLILACLALTTCAFAYGSGTGEAVYTNRWSLASGFTYENAFSYNSSGSRNETFLIENKPGSSIYPIVLACDTIYGGMTITQMISYAEGLCYNVVGAINADFGYWETRIPCGMVVEDGIYKSSPEGNSAIGFTDGRAYASYKPEVYITLENDTQGSSVTTTHLNKTRADNGLYLYSEYFSTVSTRTSTSGWYVRMKVLSGEITLDGEMQLEVVDIIQGEKSVPIGEGYVILTASDAAGQDAALSKFSIGDRVTLSTECSDSKLAQQDWVSGSGNIIAKDGKVFDEDGWDSSITSTNPRTAIGIKSDGTVVYLVMDGRTTVSKGSTLRELAEDMISMGCTTVVNMDGGGSSTLALRMPGKDGFTIVNEPSDGSLRSVCSYILFVTDSAASGSARNLLDGARLRGDGQRAQNGRDPERDGLGLARERERERIHRPGLGGDRHDKAQLRLCLRQRYAACDNEGRHSQHHGRRERHGADERGARAGRDAESRGEREVSAARCVHEPGGRDVFG